MPGYDSEISDFSLTEKFTSNRHLSEKRENICKTIGFQPFGTF